jgi:hypothetical protein
MTDIDLNAAKDRELQQVRWAIQHAYEKAVWETSDKDEGFIAASKVIVDRHAAEVAKITEERDNLRTTTQGDGAYIKRIEAERDGLAAVVAATLEAWNTGVERDDDGVDYTDPHGTLDSMWNALTLAPTATLAARDAEKKAEVLEEAADLRFLAVVRVLKLLDKAAEAEDPDVDEWGHAIYPGYFTITYEDAFRIAEDAITRTRTPQQGEQGHEVRTSIINGSGKTYGNADARENPEHLCGQCRTPLGKSTIRCPNEPKEDD